MYSKFHEDRKGEKHLKLGAKKVSGAECTSPMPILGEFLTVIRPNQM